MKKNYSAVLFDLDHTLWDYEKNSRETLQEMFIEFSLGEKLDASFNEFHNTFQEINTTLWSKYDQGLIGRDVIRKNRFSTILSQFNLDDPDLSERLSDTYINYSPKKGNLMPGAEVILNYLNPKYELFIITNGFEEVQFTKVKSSGIENYFKEVVISDRVGFKKPSREIFDHVADKHGHQHQSLIMIGDNLLTDIAGANNAGIDSVFFNPSCQSHSSAVTYEISTLNELTKIL